MRLVPRRLAVPPVAGSGLLPLVACLVYRNAIVRQSAGRSEVRVLISGSADFSTFALVHGQMADSAKITCLDLCPTPLIATSWYARRIGAPVPEMLVADATEHNRPGSYDIIVSDSFLPRFRPGGRRCRTFLLSNWFAGSRLFVANQERHTSLDTSILRVLFAEAESNYATVSTDVHRGR